MTYDRFCEWRDHRLATTPRLSIVIPAYNERDRIVPTIAAIAAHVCGLGLAWELIVSDDGSTDGTPELVRGLGLVNVRVLTPEHNHGKGHAVRTGIRAARGELVLFSDADLSTPIQELDRLLDAVDDGADVAIGSRANADAGEARRTMLRRCVSRAHRTVVRLMFPIGIDDSQCGFKLFRADAARRLVAAQTLDGFSFDLELLWVARRLRMDVRELPVRWVDAPGSTVDPLRDSLRFLGDMIRIRLRHRGRTAPAGLRVAVVSPHPPSGRTLNEYGFHLVRHLVANEDVAEVVLLCDDGPEGIPSPGGVVVDPCWRFDDPTNLFRIVRAVRRHRPDVVLLNIQFASFGDRKLAAGLGLCTPALLRLARVPSVVLLHNLVDTVDLEVAGFANNRLATRVLTAIGRGLTRTLLTADRVAVTIPAYVEILRRRYGADNVYLAPHGSFGPDEAASTVVPDRPRLLSFGKFGTYKRVDDLVDAYRLLLARGHDDLELVVAGTDSPNTPGYLEGVRRANTDLPSLTFTGYVLEEDVPALFQAATMVVFSYTGTTGSSGPLHQAGEHGRATVLPAIGDFLDVIEEEGYTGECFTPGDVESLAAAIERLLTDPERREAIAAQNAAAAAGLTIRGVVDLHVLHLLAAV